MNRKKYSTPRLNEAHKNAKIIELMEKYAIDLTYDRLNFGKDVGAIVNETITNECAIKFFKEFYKSEYEVMISRRKYNVMHSENYRKKISMANKGRRHSEKQNEEHSRTMREKYSTGQLVSPTKGKPMHPNARRALQKANKNKKQTPEAINKMLETKRRNGTFNTSRGEEIVYEELCSLFNKDDVARQYKSDFYPFRCDFYIKSKDLYIECDFNWTHGGHPFNASHDEDIEIIELWIERANDGKKYYKNALQTWVVRDYLKIYHQEKNKLNFKRFYTLKEAKTWINSQK